MISSFIAFDDNDAELGYYFQESHDDIQLTIALNNDITNLSIRGLDCTKAFINNTVSKVNGGRFVFIALSHGNEEELVSHEVYVSSVNSNCFINSLFYTCACSTGYALGNHLINAGCTTYIGYSDTVFVILDCTSVFYTCQNYAIKSFFSNNESIGVSFDKMINFYNSEIDRLILGDVQDLIVASSLINNRDCLIILGDSTVTRNDFNI